MDFDGTSTWHGPVTPVDGGHLIDVGPPGPGEQVRGANSGSLRGLGQGNGAQRRRFLTGAGPVGRPETPGLRSPLATQWVVAGQPAVKLGIEQAGWYRVAQPELVAAGLDPTVDPCRLHLLVDGVEHALRVTGERDGRFDAQDAIEFYGTGVDTAYTGTRVYWLVAGTQPGLRMSPAPRGAVRGGPQGAGAASFWGTLEQKDRSIYFAALENGDAENWFGTIVWAWPTDLVVPVSNLDPAAPSAAELEVTLQGVTRSEATPDHIVAVLVNGTEVGELRFDGRNLGVQTFLVPHAVLREGANTVRLIARGEGWDFSLVDTLRLSYWHTYRPDRDALRFAVEGGETVTVGGFASGAIEVVDVTNPAAVNAVSSTVEAARDGFWATTARVPGVGRRTLLAFSAATVGAPVFVEANRPTSWHAGSQAADYVVITHETFAGALGPLMTLRAQQGHEAALVDIEDVYDEFSFGQKTPQALKEFLTRAQTSWQRPPRFVVLAGDATVDPRDYAGFGDADFVPTKLVGMDSVELESSTDDWFADMDGDDLADLAMGRLPMRTVEHAETMVAKLVGYEQAAARAELFDRVDDGQLLVNYLGHGSTTIWGQSGLLTSGDLTSQGRPGARLPLVVAMNCLNGLFQGIYGEESLAEAFLRSPEGAVAMWASSSITNAVMQSAVNQEFFRLVFSGAFATVGESVAAAKAVVTDRDVRRSWIFLGDPAMRLKGVPRATDALDRLTSTPTSGPVRAALNDTDSDTDATPSKSDDDAGATGEPEPAAAVVQHLADFDGDGRDDVLTYAAETGLWTLAFADVQGFRYVIGAWAAHAHLVVAHLTDDRRPDVFGYNTQTGDWFQALNVADGTFTTHAGAWTPGWQTALGDLDGDGRDDVFLSDPEVGLWFQSLTDGVGGFSYHAGGDLPAGIVHLADFNADRRADSIVPTLDQRPAEGRSAASACWAAFSASRRRNGSEYRCDRSHRDSSS